jgi:hypothetical protein
MSNKKLHKIEYETHGKDRMYFEKHHKCWYFMEKEAEGYSASHENQLIFNFKKGLEKKNTPEWFYRNQSIKKFAEDLNKIKFPEEWEYVTVIPAPTSKARNSKYWNDRIDKVVELWAKKNTKIKIEYVIDVDEDIKAAHEGGERDPEYIKNHLIWKDFIQNPSPKVLLIDDVYTTGGHFKAFRDFILEKDNRIEEVIGIFWALHVWKLP